MSTKSFYLDEVIQMLDLGAENIGDEDQLLEFTQDLAKVLTKHFGGDTNNPQTWRALGRLIIPFLQDIKEKGGLYDYAFQCDEETNTPAVIDRNEMIARVFVKPTKTAEFIELNLILTAISANNEIPSDGGIYADFDEDVSVEEFMEDVKELGK